MLRRFTLEFWTPRKEKESPTNGATRSAVLLRARSRVNADTRRLARKANVTRLAVYTASLVSDGEESVEANCFRARNNLERIAPGGTCSIAPASFVVYS